MGGLPASGGRSSSVFGGFHVVKSGGRGASSGTAASFGGAALGVEVSCDGVAAGKRRPDGFGCVAGVVDAPNKPLPCSDLLGVAGGNVEAKAFPKNESPDVVAGFSCTSFDELSLWKVDPSSNPLLGRPRAPFGGAGGSWGVGVASSRSLFCTSLTSLVSDSLLDPNEDVPCPKTDPSDAGVPAQEGNEDPVPDGIVTVEPPKLGSVLSPLKPLDAPPNAEVCCPRPENAGFCCPKPEKPD